MIPEIDGLELSRQDKEHLLSLLTEQSDREKYNYIDTLWLDDEHAITLPGCIKSLSRTNYPKHLEFFAAGVSFTERAFIAGNRCGKTLTGLCELYYHCSGEYPKWWKGKRFDKPIVAWLCGDRGEVIRDGMQPLLMGHTEFGTGIIPLDKFAEEPDSMPGVPGGKGQYHIKHKSGGVSRIIIKTYQAGKDAFESAAVDVIMLDEECPLEIYVEAQMRTATTGGCVYLTFTPDSGLTDTVLHFYEKPKAGEPARFVTTVGWNDVPHLAEAVKQNLLAAIPPHMRDVKTKGVPYLGVGAIYPIPEEDIICEPFQIPHWWPRAYALDPSWNRTAAIWGAYNEKEDTWYLYSEYVRGQVELPVHVDAIKARGKWVRGVVDPYAVGGGKGKDGEAFLEAYLKQGLDLQIANNAVEAGIQEVYQRLSSGRLKIFKTLNNFFYEYRMYRRDDKGRIVKKNDDILDATRYLMMSGLDVMDSEPQDDEDEEFDSYNSDIGRSGVTGY